MISFLKQTIKIISHPLSMGDWVGLLGWLHTKTVYPFQS